MSAVRKGVFGMALAGAAVMLSAGVASAQKKDRDVITREEIITSAQKDGDLYSAIRSLRPHFLAKPRGQRKMDLERDGAGSSPGASAGLKVGSSMAPEPLLYVNGNRMGEIAILKTILAADTYEVRYLNPVKAEEEYGPDANGGAVVVKLVEGIKAKP